LGVVADIRHGGPFGQMGSEVFLPFTASADSLHRALALTIVVRPSGTNPDLASQLRRAAQSVGPRVLVERIRSGGDWLGERVITPRRRTVLLGLLGGLGLVLAIVGVFGMTAYSVSRRTQEIGVRMAFGARPGPMVLRMVRDAAVPIAIGTVVGLGGAALATRLIASFLFQTDPIDPITFAAVAALLVAAGGLAAWIPARRAATIDPVTALRAE
jgi:putative ABC transport system permease protein